MPGPTDVGQSRSVVVRGILAALVVIALVTAVAVVTVAVRHDRAPDAAVSDQPSARQPTPAIVPTPGSTGAATCTDPVARREWRVTWRAAGVILIPTGFAVRPTSTTVLSPAPASTTPTATANIGSTLPGGWRSRNADTWMLRWSPTGTEIGTAAKDEKWARKGSLATLAAIRMTVRQDPRFVTPDGACSVYLAPFVSGTVGSRDAVAVIGDSLVAQLYAAEDGTTTGTGILLNRLTTAGDRAEIVGQGGRPWSIKPTTGSGLATGDAGMLDEIRGLREARSVVIALGTNDAGWVALAPDREQYELRLAWVLMHLGPILDELRDHGHCTVLATMATRHKSYQGSRPGRFDAAAIRINAYLRQRANADPNDRLRLWDWAVQADKHGTLDPQPWFGPHTIHLSPVGLAPYADELASAAALC